jgi:hypothetical protein
MGMWRIYSNPDPHGVVIYRDVIHRGGGMIHRGGGGMIHRGGGVIHRGGGVIHRDVLHRRGGVIQRRSRYDTQRRCNTQKEV